MEGLPPRRARPVQEDDDRYRRVHPPLPHHVLPTGFHRIRHYGLFASHKRAENISRARELLNVPAPQYEASDAAGPEVDEPQALSHPCPCCGGRMIIIETFERGCSPRYRPTAPLAAIRLDTS